MQYSFDVLKQSIEYLAKMQNDQANILKNLQADMNSAGTTHHTSQKPVTPPERPISKNDSKTVINNEFDNSGNEKKMNDLSAMIKELKRDVAGLNDKTDNTNTRLSGTEKSLDGLKEKMQENFDNTNKKLDDHGQRITDLESQIAILKSMGPSTGGEDNSIGLLDAIKEMVDKLRDECNDMFCLQVDHEKLQERHDDLSQRVKATEDKNEEQDFKLRGLDTAIADHNDHFDKHDE
jgi:chromosome segregation ATPase